MSVHDALGDLARRLAALEDRAAIAALVASYGPAADSGDAAGAAALWSEDGTYDVGGFGEARGRAEIAGLIESTEHRALMAAGCAHLLGPLAITVEGDTAAACGHSVVFRRTEAGGFEAYRVSANRWSFARIEGQWQVTQRRNALLDGDEAARALLRL